MCEIVYNILITNFTVHRCIIRSNAPSNLQMQPLGCIFVYALNCITFGTAIEHAAGTDTRFGSALSHIQRLETICEKPVIRSIPEAEPIGPKHLTDILVVAPCTGNTLAKLAASITDTTATMAVKSHLRTGNPVVLAVATNDALAGSAKNIGQLLNLKHYRFVPFGQDQPTGKPTSLIADFTKIPQTLADALDGKQQQPILLS